MPTIWLWYTTIVQDVTIGENWVSLYRISFLLCLITAWIYNYLKIRTFKKENEKLSLEISGKELNKISCIHSVDYYAAI